MGATKGSLAILATAMLTSACSTDNDKRFDEAASAMISCTTYDGEGKEIERELCFRDEAGRDTLTIMFSRGVLVSERRSEYDAAGRATRVHEVCSDGSEAVGIYEYEGDLRTRLISPTNIHCFEYDSLGKPTTERIYGRDANGNATALLSKIVRRYDESGEPRYSAFLIATETGIEQIGSDEYEYDEGGRLALTLQSAGDTHTKTLSTYNAAGDIIESKTYIINAADGSETLTARTTFAYDFDSLQVVESDYAYDDRGLEVLTLRRVSRHSERRQGVSL